ncbi:MULTISPECIES: hypothetical protein [Rhodomicrobium]|uniref:hypothetical protein n=1 Tax=Rhodomicrobium TaxID=1068 RepID=UPI000F7354E4|nr:MULTISPECIES: hypothetical protein [Rhodomicrobium]
MKSMLRCALLFGLLAVPSAARAEDPEKLASVVPAEISEVVSGGTWSDSGASGVYRAIVVSPSAVGQANVLVQMLALDKTDVPPKVVRTVLIKEVADKKLANAFLAMDAETENEMTLIITAYGAESEQDTSLHVKFDAKGKYEIMPSVGEDAPAPAEPKK